MNAKMDRRTFLRHIGGGSLASAAFALIGGRLDEYFVSETMAAETAAPIIAVARDKAPETLVRNAVAALGGISKFVSRGDVVIVKPNIAWDRTPEQAATTNPEVVKSVVMMCLEAGAAKVRVMDRPCNDPRRCYQRSGIKDAVESIGHSAVSMEHMDDRRFVSHPSAKADQAWTFYRDVLEADKRINVPIAKHHSATRLTMSLKNVMGCVGGNRGNIHHDLDRNIAELNLLLKFDLIVLDAVRILTGNGPQGGKLQDVRRSDRIIAGTNPVSIDSLGATLFGITGDDVPHVRIAAGLGLGEIDLKKVKVLEA